MQNSTHVQKPLWHYLTVICCVSICPAANTHTHTQWETPSSSEESIGVVWKERGWAAGEKSSRSDFHPETVHWFPTTLWSPGGNNIQLTFHWRNLIPPSPASDTLLQGWHTCTRTPRCKPSTHACTQLEKHSYGWFPSKSHPLTTDIFLNHTCDMFRRSYCRFGWCTDKTRADRVTKVGETLSWVVEQGLQT